MSCILSQLLDNQPAIIQQVNDTYPNDPIAQRLRDLGFLQGESVTIKTRAPFRQDPLLVQIGVNYWALRKSEAARVQILAGTALTPRKNDELAKTLCSSQVSKKQYSLSRAHSPFNQPFNEKTKKNSPFPNPAPAARAAFRIALIGHPNAGKTTLFNQLTGMRQKVANYAGVTVERKLGLINTPAGRALQLLDLPGIYSFKPVSPDEAITRQICLNEYSGEAPINCMLCIADASNLRLHLRLVLAAKQLGHPIILGLTMLDIAQRREIQIDAQQLEKQLAMPVVMLPTKGDVGVRQLLQRMDIVVSDYEKAIIRSKDRLRDENSTRDQDQAQTTDEKYSVLEDKALPSHCLMARARKNRHFAENLKLQMPPAKNPTADQIPVIMKAAVRKSPRAASYEAVIDRWVLHPVLGLGLLACVMFGMFQAVFSWSEPLKAGIETGVIVLGHWVAHLLPRTSILYSLLNEGVFAGIGTILAFFPQILLLFLFILILEDSGYLPRAAFLLDPLLFKVGLTGRAFIPLLSSFACAIPSIMATRSIQDPRDRLITILITPLITCSARLPIYTLLIAAFIPQKLVWGLFNLQGIVLFLLYSFGLISALIVACVMKYFRRGESTQMLLMELPAWRLPLLRDLIIGLWERARIFLKNVGSIILALTILLWFFSQFPAPPVGATEPAIYYSLAGIVGRYLAVLFEPLGFNWQICIALIPGLAAREVILSALGTVYAMSGSSDSFSAQLGNLIANQWSLATALSLLTWYVFAPQCLSTLAVIQRETHSWRSVCLATGYLFGLAYGFSLLVYQLSTFLS
jgi:ferrous iron transport protein B